MRTTIVRAGVPAVLVCALSGCPDSSDPVPCTLELRSAVMVVVSSPQGLPVDSVTAEQRSEAECEGGGPASDAEDASQHAFEYWCWEQGGGTYVVRVTSGDMTWTQRTHVSANACHTTSHPTLTFVLDPDTAD